MLSGLFGERKRRRSRRRSREAGVSLFGERKRSRSRRRSRKHTKVGLVHAHKRRVKEPRVSLFGGLTERRRKRSRSRRRSRERSRSRVLFGAGERKRRSRSRLGKRVRTAARRALGLGERRRRRSRSRRRSREVSRFAGLGERKRRRSRSRRRSREATRFVGERKRRRSRSRRRSREIAPRFFGLGERVRRRRSRSRRRSREAGLFGLSARRNGAFYEEVLKPGAIAAVGLVGTRLIAQQVGKLTASIAPSSPTLARWVPTAVSGLSAWGAYTLANRVSALRPYRRYLAIGAGLAVVEELLAVVLPMVGIAPGMQGISGTLGNALYGVDGGGGMGFPCFTGSCPQGVALPFNQGMPCAPGGTVQAYMTPGQAVQQAVAPGAAAGMGFPCFTGSCPQGVAPGFPNPPCMDPNAAAPAAANAVAASGFSDPVAQSVLAGLSGKADEIINASGVLRQ